MVMALIIVMARLLGKAFECSFSAFGTIKMSVFYNFPLVRIRTFPRLNSLVNALHGSIYVVK
ncbi:hypothetical protein DXV65_01415 [Pseudomonas fluorescens]|nr:hypothetical protein DXV65_01415 [Pseudomonas fluorescens]